MRKPLLIVRVESFHYDLILEILYVLISASYVATRDSDWLGLIQYVVQGAEVGDFDDIISDR